MSQVMSQEMTLLRPRCQQWMLWARAHTSIFVWARAQTPIMEGLGPGPDDVWAFILYCAFFILLGKKGNFGVFEEFFGEFGHCDDYTNHQIANSMQIPKLVLEFEIEQVLLKL